MEYRREIDGLRAIAVLPVVLFHVGFEVFRGGFVGVDVFFVISGYLITKNMLTELEEGTFSIFKFYERRARRILPALFLVLLVSVPLAWTLLRPAELVNFSKSLISVVCFASNIFFSKDVGYFETSAELKPLLHTWSLSVEEQYYIFFPIILIFLFKSGRRSVLQVLWALFLLSFVIAEVSVFTSPGGSFFSISTRAWEILSGALLVFYPRFLREDVPSKKANEFFGWFGLALILFSVLFYDKNIPFPSHYSLAPTLGASLVILFAGRGTFVGRFLGSRVFVLPGLCSYSIYLWHQPVFAFFRHFQLHDALPSRFYLVLFVLVISLLSWIFVEKPFRSGAGFFDRPFIFLFSVCGFVFFGLLGWVVSRIDFQRESLMAKTLAASPAVYSSNINERIFVKCLIGTQDRVRDTVVLGSSRLMQVGEELLGREVLNLSVSGAALEDILAIWHLISEKSDPKTVLIGADPWLFNANFRRKPSHELEAEYNLALHSLNRKPDLSFSRQTSFQFRNKYIVEIYNSMNVCPVSASDDSPSVFDKIRSDGSRVYNLAYSSKSPAEVCRRAPEFLQYGIKNYNYSKDLRIIFEEFVKSIRRDRRVVLVLSPYHPALYELLRGSGPLISATEDEFRQIAIAAGVEIIGSYDPGKVGCSALDFFDGIHAKESGMRRVMCELSR